MEQMKKYAAVLHTTNHCGYKWSCIIKTSVKLCGENRTGTVTSIVPAEAKTQSKWNPNASTVAGDAAFTMATV